MMRRVGMPIPRDAQSWSGTGRGRELESQVQRQGQTKAIKKVAVSTTVTGERGANVRRWSCVMEDWKNRESREGRKGREGGKVRALEGKTGKIQEGEGSQG